MRFGWHRLRAQQSIRKRRAILPRCEISRQRVAALLHHEIGTHLLTWHNGKQQKLRLMHSGLAGYEGFQEGLALLAEFLSGGLTAGRLRLLAARVLACRAMLTGATFLETFHPTLSPNNPQPS